MRVKKLNQKGFSLIELMIVVGIIGVLATMAVPKFSAFQAKAKQTEAKTTLNHIYTLQEAYFIDFSLYANSGATPGDTDKYGANLTAVTEDPQCDTPPTWSRVIGFTLTPCNASKPIYSYSAAGANGATYTATAETGINEFNKLYPACASPDSWSMTNSHTLQHPSDGISLCN